MSLPVPFQGSDQQRRRNRQSHRWFTVDGDDYRCAICDTKDWHAAAEYPCGQDLSRLPLGKVPFETDGTGIVDPAYDLPEPEPRIIDQPGWGFQ